MKTINIYAKSIFMHTLAVFITLTLCSVSLADPPRPQIPKENFEWQGHLVGNSGEVIDQQLKYDLVVRGKWQNGYFNLFMEQGSERDDYWVKNLVFEDKLYSITYKWHEKDSDFGGLLGVCFETTVYNKEDPSKPLNISVDDLNHGLAVGSRLVGVEKVNGKPMNHFRQTCLAQTAPQLFYPPYSSDPDNPLTLFSIPFNIFSDIYVPVGESYPWSKWLQFGDGVGPDAQSDEWFLANRFNSHPKNIVLPVECQKDNVKSNLAYVQQTTCKNLVPGGVAPASTCSSVEGCYSEAGGICGSAADQCAIEGLQCRQEYGDVNDFCCCDSS